MAWRILRLFVQRKRDVIPLCFGQQQCARRALEQILSATYPPFYGCLSFTGAALMEF
jgi:hypothetical protein